MAFHEFDDNNEEVEKFIKSVQFFSENNEKPSEAVEMFWNMAKHIVN